MLPRHHDPIVAIATAPGRGAVGIVRVSGRGLEPLAQRLTGRVLRPRVAHYGPFLDAQGQVLDQGLALFFPGPHSYTGEDVLELQAHGGPVLLQLLVARCLEVAASPLEPGEAARVCCPGLRLAQPGEFTERAFLNDKLDLAQAEAVADLIDASTEAAARSAARSLSGALSRPVQALREALVQLRMLVEATLDFPEEEIDFLEAADASGRLERLAATLDHLADSAQQGALLREGLNVVIAGQPNAGKSSLLNALAGAELAIVTPIAGTTRDRISETLQIEGVPIHIVDTAGLRGDHETGDEIERIGIGRSWQAIEQADAVLFLHDLTRCGEPAYAQADVEIARRLPTGARIVDVYNKDDAASPEMWADMDRLQCRLAATGDDRAEADRAALTSGVLRPGLRLSARTGVGIDALRRRLLELAGWHAVPEGAFIARERHVQALRQAQGHLERARGWCAQGNAALDLLAEELRLTHEALGEITGRLSADDLLGEIFGRFCIGK